MVTDQTFVPTLIQPGNSIRIQDGAGTQVCALEGTVWITQEGDQRDVVLGPGDRFTLDRAGLALLVALEEAASVRLLSTGDRSVLHDLAAAGIIAANRCATSKSDRRLALAG